MCEQGWMEDRQMKRVEQPGDIVDLKEGTYCLVSRKEGVRIALSMGHNFPVEDHDRYLGGGIWITSGNNIGFEIRRYKMTAREEMPK